MQSFKDKVIFITGGANGIGLGVAQAFVADGANVVLADIDAAGAERAAADLNTKGGKALSVALDVTDPAQWQRSADVAEKAFGPVDILFSNAGVVTSPRPVLDLDVEELRWLFEINFYGMLHGVQCFAPRLRGRGGYIVLTDSIAGLAPAANMAAYAASKHALLGLVPSLREELAAQGIGLSVLCPGLVRTQMMVNSNRIRGAKAEAAEFQSVVSAQQFGAVDPQEIGPMVLQAIRARQGFVFTHPFYRERVERIMQFMLQGFDVFDTHDGRAAE